MLDKCAYGAIKLHPFSSCLASLGTYTKEAQFYCPSHTYAAIPYCTIFPFLDHCGTQEHAKNPK